MSTKAPLMDKTSAQPAPLPKPTQPLRPKVAETTTQIPATTQSGMAGDSSQLLKYEWCSIEAQNKVA